MKINNKVKEKIFIVGMLAIPVLHFLVFWIYVNFNSIIMAFQRNDLNGNPQWSFYWFEQLWEELHIENSTLWIATRNTLIYFLSNQLIVLPISIVLCYFLYKKIWGYKVFRVVFYLPSIISASVLVILFQYIISYDGPVGVLITKVYNASYPSFLADSRYAMKTILFYCISFGFGGNIVLLSGAMSHIEEGIIDAGKIDGVNTFQEMVLLVIPMIWPTLSTLIIFAFVGMFGASGPILLFTEGAYDTTTISYWIYEKVYYGGTYNFPAAIGFVFTCIGTPIALGMRKLLSKGDVEV